MNLDMTRWIRFLFMSLGFAYPIRFVAGFSLSILIYYGLLALQLEYPKSSLLTVIANSPGFFVVALGTVIAFGQSLFRPLIGSDRLTSSLDAVEEVMRRAKYSDQKKRQVWSRVADDLLSSLNVAKEVDEARMRALAEDAISQEERIAHEDRIAREDAEIEASRKQTNKDLLGG